MIPSLSAPAATHRGPGRDEVQSAGREGAGNGGADLSEAQVAATEWPARANARAVSKPMPTLQPVMRTVDMLAARFR